MLLTDAVLPLEEAGVLLPDALPDAPEEPELLPEEPDALPDAPEEPAPLPEEPDAGCRRAGVFCLRQGFMAALLLICFPSIVFPGSGGCA